MGRVINSTFMSLDGIINRMEAWHFDFIDDETNEIALEQIQACDSLLMGRETYDVYADVWPARDGAYADRINSMRKYVASTTLKQADWTNTTVLGSDLVERVRLLRQQPGDILMHGYGPVARTLLTHGLLDELFLWVHPVIAGVGDTSDFLWNEGTASRLSLLDTQTLKSGVVTLSYQPSNVD